MAFKYTFRTLVILLSIITISCTNQPNEKTTSSKEQSIKEIREVLNKFFEGFENIDTTSLKNVLHPEGISINIYSDSIKETYFKDWIKDVSVVKSFPSHPWNNTTPQKNILSLEVHDNSASAKIEWVYPNERFIDYYSFIRMDDQWFIMNKIWYAVK